MADDRAPRAGHAGERCFCAHARAAPIFRPVGSIDRTVSLNRALWVLAEEMRKLKA